jgi:hypothetical protein
MGIVVAQSIAAGTGIVVLPSIAGVIGTVVARSIVAAAGIAAGFADSDSLPLDYIIDENSLKEISRMTIGPEDLVSRLRKAKQAADRGETIDVPGWTREQIARRFFT